MIDIIAGALLLIGSFLALAAAIALVRFPDLFSRMHAATKPQSLGLICILIGTAMRLGTVGAYATVLVIIAFQLLTAPVASHMVGRAASRIGLLDSNSLVRNDLD